MYIAISQKEIIIDMLKKEIPELQALYIFGSYADGTATSSSDIDIAYLTVDVLTPTQRWDISQKLAILLSHDVDLIELKETNTVFRYQILSKGTRIFGEGYEVESFETLAYSFYLRFQEERKPIMDEILKNRSVFGSKETQSA
ncbi:MAG: nucleotidyltransferase [Sulfurovum sp.]|nr:MAG: nucleotidyltransferase [Sulfurovum sp.]